MPRRSSLRTSLVLPFALASAISCGPLGEPSGRREAVPFRAPEVASSAPSPPLPSATTSAQAGADEETFASTEVFALRIRGGEVVDGTGRARRRADVLVRGTEIAFVGRVADSVRAEREIDATHAVVTPGFIDMHSHADPFGNVEPALAQGVTTIVVGQDGQSPSRHIAAWLRRVDEERSRINVATLVGHATARSDAGLGTKTKLTDADRRALGDAVRRGLDEGALGLSTGLEYDPGRLADEAELVAAAVPVGERHALVMSHLRSEDDDRIEASLDELVEQGRRTGAKVHVAHMKVVYGHGAARAEALLDRLARAREAGVDVTADMYPYDASYTTIAILFPPFARSGAPTGGHTEKEILAYLHERVLKRNGPEATLFGSGRFAGKTLAEAAASRGVPFERVLYDLGPSGAAAAYFVMDDALETRLLVDPFVSIGTDGGGGDPHPRSHGTFTKVLTDLVAARSALTLEEAVRKMSGLAAHTLGLDGRRGCLAAGCAADIDVFVPSELRTRADFQKPDVLSEGMRAVIVNGQVVRADGAATRARPGRAVRLSDRAVASTR